MKFFLCFLANVVIGTILWTVVMGGLGISPTAGEDPATLCIKPGTCHGFDVMP